MRDLLDRMRSNDVDIRIIAIKQAIASMTSLTAIQFISLGGVQILIDSLESDYVALELSFFLIINTHGSDRAQLFPLRDVLYDVMTTSSNPEDIFFAFLSVARFKNCSLHLTAEIADTILLCIYQHDHIDDISLLYREVITSMCSAARQPRNRKFFADAVPWVLDEYQRTYNHEAIILLSYLDQEPICSARLDAELDNRPSGILNSAVLVRDEDGYPSGVKILRKLTEKDKFSCSPLDYAYQSIETTERLLRMGATVTGENMFNSLRWSSIDNFLQLLKVYGKATTKYDLQRAATRTFTGDQLFDCGNHEVLEFLVAAGVNFDPNDGAGFYPLRYSAHVAHRRGMIQRYLHLYLTWKHTKDAGLRKVPKDVMPLIASFVFKVVPLTPDQ